MKALADAGYPQAVIPPHERPNVPLLRQLGFSGSDEQVVARAAQQEPDLLSAVSSASAMWVAERGDCVSLRRFAGWPGASDGGESAG